MPAGLPERNKVLNVSSCGEIRYWYDPELIKAGLTHGFLGRTPNFRDRQGAAELVCKNFGGKSLNLLKQTHSTIFHSCSSTVGGPAAGILAGRLNPASPEGDGWCIELTTRRGFSAPGQSVPESSPEFFGVLTADCIPVIVYSPAGREPLLPSYAAALHCGWRGTVGGLLQQTIKALEQKTGAAAAGMRVAIGPGAGCCCYQIGAELLDTFFEAESRCSKLVRSAAESSVIRGAGGTYFADIKKLLALQAANDGVRPDKIQIAAECTICDSRFYSFRREKEDTGRQLTFISGVLKPE